MICHQKSPSELYEEWSGLHQQVVAGASQSYKAEQRNCLAFWTIYQTVAKQRDLAEVVYDESDRYYLVKDAERFLGFRISAELTRGRQH